MFLAVYITILGLYSFGLYYHSKILSWSSSFVLVSLWFQVLTKRCNLIIFS